MFQMSFKRQPTTLTREAVPGKDSLGQFPAYLHLLVNSSRSRWVASGGKLPSSAQFWRKGLFLRFGYSKEVIEDSPAHYRNWVISLSKGLSLQKTIKTRKDFNCGYYHFSRLYATLVGSAWWPVGLTSLWNKCSQTLSLHPQLAPQLCAPLATECQGCSGLSWGAIILWETLYHKQTVTQQADLASQESSQRSIRRGLKAGGWECGKGEGRVWGTWEQPLLILWHWHPDLGHCKLSKLSRWIERGTQISSQKCRACPLEMLQSRPRALHIAWRPSLTQYCFPKWHFSGTQSHSLIYAAWVWQQQNCRAVTENLRPAQPKIFALWLFAGKVHH